MSATNKGEYTSYDAIGTAASPATLTAAYTGNRKTLLCKYLPNVHLDFTYTPASNNDYALILIEASNDDGTTFYPISNVVYGTAETDVYADSGTSTTSGIPLIVPGDKTSTASTAVVGYVDFTTVASHVRISARESAANGGTLHVRATFLS